VYAGAEDAGTAGTTGVYAGAEYAGAEDAGTTGVYAASVDSVHDVETEEETTTDATSGTEGVYAGAV
jgi:hypothetical protein